MKKRDICEFKDGWSELIYTWIGNIFECKMCREKGCESCLDNYICLKYNRYFFIPMEWLKIKKRYLSYDL